MRTALSCLAICLLILSLSNPVSAEERGPGRTSVDAAKGGITLKKAEALQERAARLARLGRNGEASRLRKSAAECGSAENAAPGRNKRAGGPLPSDVVSAVRSRPGSVISRSPWAEDVLIYQGDCAYNAWLYGNSFAADYDSSGNLFAAVGLADSTVHIFYSDDVGATWTDELTISFTTPELQTQLDIVACDEGDSTILNLYYLYPGVGHLRSLKVDYGTWTELANPQIDDTVTSYWIARDQYWENGYYLYAVYDRQSTLYFVWSGDRGSTWDTPVGIGADVGGPCVTYGGYSGEGHLYVGCIYKPLEDTSSAWVTRSTDYGTTWDTWQLLYSGGAANDDVVDVVLAATHATDPLTQTVHALLSVDCSGTGDLDLSVVTSTDGGGSWSSRPGIAYSPGMDEHLASVEVFRGEDQDIFHCAYYMDDTLTGTFDSVMYVYTDTDSWEAEKPGVSVNDSLYAPGTRPQLVFGGGGIPGIAYAGVSGRNIYYDSAWFTEVEEEADDRGERVPGISLENSPNPFRERTSIQYALSAEGRISLRIHNVSGQVVRTLREEPEKAGQYSVVWDGLDGLGEECAAGIYICRLSAGSTALSRKLVLVR
jgi:hypothetical protein